MPACLFPPQSTHLLRCANHMCAEDGDGVAYAPRDRSDRSAQRPISAERGHVRSQQPVKQERLLNAVGSGAMQCGVARCGVVRSDVWMVLRYLRCTASRINADRHGGWLVPRIRSQRRCAMIPADVRERTAGQVSVGRAAAPPCGYYRTRKIRPLVLRASSSFGMQSDLLSLHRPAKMPELCCCPLYLLLTDRLGEKKGHSLLQSILGIVEAKRTAAVPSKAKRSRTSKSLW